MTKKQFIIGLLSQAQDFASEFYAAPYRATMAKAGQDEDDILMLFVFAELMGIPNPVAYQTLELQPLLIERFHSWHRRIGISHSPLDHIRCC